MKKHKQYDEQVARNKHDPYHPACHNCDYGVYRLFNHMIMDPGISVFKKQARKPIQSLFCSKKKEYIPPRQMTTCQLDSWLARIDRVMVDGVNIAKLRNLKNLLNETASKRNPRKHKGS